MRSATEVSISYPWPESLPSLLLTIRSPRLRKFVVHFSKWDYKAWNDARYVERLMDTDHKFCEAYNQWTKHVTGTIQVEFHIQGVESKSLGNKTGIERYLARFTENVAVSFISAR